MVSGEDELARLRVAILADDPGLADARFRLLHAGWDSLAVDVDDRLIFRFPRHEEGEEQFRREASMLALARRHLTLPIPSITIQDGDVVYSRHDKIAGDHLSGGDYARLDDAARDRLAADLGRFYAELHAIPVAEAQAAGALPADDDWPEIDEILAGLRERLPAALLGKAEQAVARWTALPPDPLGRVFGFFDGHGWNMAFDHARGRLNGIYDFGDAGIGPLHQEFIHGTLVSEDLTARTITAYEGLTARTVDRDRVDLEDGMLRLVELAEEGDHPEHGDLIRRRALDWLGKA